MKSMNLRTRLALVLGMLALPAVIVATMGHSSNRVNLSAAMELWGDVLRDADDFGLQLTRVSARDETDLGDSIAAAVIADNHEEPGVRAVCNRGRRHAGAERLAQGYPLQVSRHQIAGVNAFAVPGGHVFITTGMLDFLHSEAELAGVLGHEISHIDLRHCIERYQYELPLKRVGAEPVGEVADLLRLPIIVGYAKYQEAEADENGMALALEAGYDPRAMVDVMKRLENVMPDPAAPPAPSGPVVEAASATADTIDIYLRSHPLNYERVEDLSGLIVSDHRWHGSREVYEGVENYRERTPMSARRYPGETRKW